MLGIGVSMQGIKRRRRKGVVLVIIALCMCVYILYNGGDVIRLIVETHVNYPQISISIYNIQYTISIYTILNINKQYLNLNMHIEYKKCGKRTLQIIIYL